MRPQDAHILIIEDDVNNLMIATQLLRLSGITHIAEATSGVEGRRLAEKPPHPDLILLDIQLPGEDGYAILEQIRKSPILRETRVIAVTANVFPQDEAQAREAGFDGFIGKPLDFDRFPAQVKAILAGEVIWNAH